MNDKQYYRAYLQLQKRHEKLSYRIVLKGLKKQFEFASREYLEQPNTPIELLVRESDTLNFITAIYQSIGIEMALLVDASLAKYKSFKPNYQVKAAKPKEYIPTNQNPKINIWKYEFVRLTQTKEIADKVTKVTETTKQQIRQVIQRGVEEKLSHKQIAKLILDETDSIKTKQRALTIARTENAVGSNKGATYAAKTSGLVLYKKWIARKVDGKTRDAHLGMVDSSPIPIDALFTVGGESMAHPCDGSNGAGAGNIVNCRCICAFVPASQVIGKGINKPKPLNHKEPVKPKQPEFDFSKPIPLDFDDINVFKPATNIADAEKYAIEKGFSKEADYSRWTKDVNVANEMNRVLFELKKDFNFDMLSKIGDKPKRAKALMSANYRNLNVNTTSWKTVRVIENNFVKYGDDKFKDISLKNLQICKEQFELTKKSIWLKRGREIEEELKHSRWTINYSADKYLESTIHHEFGHVLHDQLTGGINGASALNATRRGDKEYIELCRQLNREQIDLYNLARTNGDIYKISAYGATNNREFMAETFVMYRAKDRELPIYIKDFFDKYFKLTKLL